MIQGRDGNLYGTTDFSGTTDSGTLFRVRTDGSNFSTLVHLGNQTGNFPYGTLVQDDNGVLFGITYFLGPGSLTQGTVFQVRRDGSNFRTFISFDGPSGSYPAGPLGTTDGTCLG